MKIEDFDKEKLYIYPTWRHSNGFKVGRVTRINKKSVTFNYNDNISEEDFCLIKCVPKEQEQIFMDYILFQNQIVKNVHSLEFRYVELYKKLSRLTSMDEQFPEVSVDWNSLREEIVKLKEGFKELCEPIITVDGVRYQKDMKDFYGLWRKIDE